MYCIQYIFFLYDCARCDLKFSLNFLWNAIWNVLWFFCLWNAWLEACLSGAWKIRWQKKESRNTPAQSKSSYRCCLPALAGFWSMTCEVPELKVRLTRFERATPTSAGWCSNPAELQSHTKKNGARGIWTPGTLRYVGFQDRCIQPLCHRSKKIKM